MLANVFTFTLRRRARSTLLLCLALALVSLLYLGLWPSFEDTMQEYVEAMPEAVMAFLGDASMTDAAGYLQSTVFGVFGPIMIVGAAVSWGSGAIAGEEADHTLPLLLSAPVARLRLALEKVGAILTAMAVLLVALFGALVVIDAAFSLGIPSAGIAAGVVHLGGLGLFAGGVAFGIGAATGRKSAAMAAGIGLVVAGFVLAGAARPIDGLDWLLWLSPYHWYNGQVPVQEAAVAWGSVGLLVGFGALAAGVGLWRFRHRDLAV
jgi:ABC-2 type transport system permease protein